MRLFETPEYRHATENPDWSKSMLLLKNPQFLPNHYETLSKWLDKNCGSFNKSIFFHVHFFLHHTLLWKKMCLTLHSPICQSFENAILFCERGTYITKSIVSLLCACCISKPLICHSFYKILEPVASAQNLLFYSR